MIEIQVKEKGKSQYDAVWDGKVVATSATPLLDSARFFVERGHDPDEEIVMMRGAVRCMSGHIGKLAKLAVADDGSGPKFRKYREQNALSQEERDAEEIERLMA